MKYKIMSVVFCVFLLAGMVLNVMTPDKDISYTERRPLAQAPVINNKFIFSEDGGEVIEDYLLDQFWNRDGVRTLKVWFDRNVLHKTDTNGLYQIGDHLFKNDYPLKEDSVTKAAEKMKAIREKLLADARFVAYSIIPDKSHFAPDKDQYLSLDYGRMEELLAAGLKDNMDYLKLDELLELDDYYYTDLHWREEKLERVVEAIWTQFGIDADMDLSGMKVNEYAPFYGGYYGQSASSGEGDTLIWLTDEEIDGLIVKDYDELKKNKDKVYAEEELGSVDSYSLFFGGNSPLITIDNPSCDRGNKLVLFRDSFGSAIAPLLAKEYSQVILVDLRYMGYENVSNFVDLSEADVLFMWGQGVYNDSAMIRAF